MYDLQGLDAETVIQQLSDAYIEIDLNGNILKTNIAAQRLFEDKVQTLHGQNFPKLFEQHTEEKIKNAFRTLIREGKLAKEKAIVRGNKGVKHVEISSNLLYSNGKPYRIFNIIRDVTDTSRRHYEISRLADRLQLSENEAKLGCFEYNDTSGIRWWSQQMFKIYGLSQENGVPQEAFVINLCHIADKERLENHIREVKKEHIPYSIIHKIVTVEGETKWLQKKGEYKKNELQEDLFFGTVQDVSDLYRVKEQIAKNSRLIEIVNQTQQYLIIEGSTNDILHKCCAHLADETETDAVYLYKNASDGDYYLRAHSASETQEMIESSPRHYSYSKSEMTAWYEDLKKEQVIDTNQKELDPLERSFMGKYGIKSILVIPIHLDNKYYGFLGFDHRKSIKDWTALEKNILVSFAKKLGYFLQRADFLQELERNLSREKEQNLELKKRNDEIDNFVYATFHDLRAPITNMLGLLDVSKQKEGSEKQVLDNMDAMVNKLYGIVNEIGEYAKNIRLPLNYEIIGFDYVVGQIKKIIDQKPAKISFSLGINGLEPLNTDKLRLDILIKSILENAVFYAQSNQNPSVRINLDFDKESTTLCIENNGDFIKPKEKNDIFKMFTTFDQKSKGSGLGLYLAQEAIQKLKGELTYTSHPNRTIFKAIIPNHKNP